MRTRSLKDSTFKPSVLEVLDVQEEKNVNQRQTDHQDVMNKKSSNRQPLHVSNRPHCYRNSLVVSEPAEGTGDNMTNTGDIRFDEEE